MKLRSPITWLGGKNALAPKIISLLPKHVCYVEPFGGAAHVLIQKPSSPTEVYNDINGDVVNFLMVLRDRREELYRSVATLPYSRALFDEWRKGPAPTDRLERATRWFYINRSCVSGDMRYPGWKKGAQRWNAARYYRSACELLLPVGERLAFVQFECRDFRYVIENYDRPTTVFYVDPPYVDHEGYYAGGFTEQDHRDLAGLLSGIKGKALVSYYACGLVDELYPGWAREEIQVAKYAHVNVDGTRTLGTEVLLMNYQPPAELRLFEPEDVLCVDS